MTSSLSLMNQVATSPNSYRRRHHQHHRGSPHRPRTMRDALLRSPLIKKRPKAITASPSPGKSPLRKRLLEFERDSEYVSITNPKRGPRLLTEHQKEVRRSQSIVARNFRSFLSEQNQNTNSGDSFPNNNSDNSNSSDGNNNTNDNSGNNSNNNQDNNDKNAIKYTSSIAKKLKLEEPKMNGSHPTIIVKRNSVLNDDTNGSIHTGAKPDNANNDLSKDYDGRSNIANVNNDSSKRTNDCILLDDGTNSTSQNDEVNFNGDGNVIVINDDGGDDGAMQIDNSNPLDNSTPAITTDFVKKTQVTKQSIETVVIDDDDDAVAVVADDDCRIKDSPTAENTIVGMETVVIDDDDDAVADEDCSNKYSLGVEMNIESMEDNKNESHLIEERKEEDDTMRMVKVIDPNDQKDDYKTNHETTDETKNANDKDDNNDDVDKKTVNESDTVYEDQGNQHCRIVDEMTAETTEHHRKEKMTSIPQDHVKNDNPVMDTVQLDDNLEEDTDVVVGDDDEDDADKVDSLNRSFTADRSFLQEETVEIDEEISVKVIPEKMDVEEFQKKKCINIQNKDRIEKVDLQDEGNRADSLLESMNDDSTRNMVVEDTHANVPESKTDSKDDGIIVQEKIIADVKVDINEVIKDDDKDSKDSSIDSENIEKTTLENDEIVGLKDQVSMASKNEDAIDSKSDKGDGETTTEANADVKHSSSKKIHGSKDSVSEIETKDIGKSSSESSNDLFPRSISKRQKDAVIGSQAIQDEIQHEDRHEADKQEQVSQKPIGKQAIKSDVAGEKQPSKRSSRKRSSGTGNVETSNEEQSTTKPQDSSKKATSNQKKESAEEEQQQEQQLKRASRKVVPTRKFNFGGVSKKSRKAGKGAKNLKQSNLTFLFKSAESVKDTTIHPREKKESNLNLNNNSESESNSNSDKTNTKKGVSPLTTSTATLTADESLVQSTSIDSSIIGTNSSSNKLQQQAKEIAIPPTKETVDDNTKEDLRHKEMALPEETLVDRCDKKERFLRDQKQPASD
eukprot:Awhi_evm1s11560